MNHRWCSSSPRSLWAFRTTSRLHAVPFIDGRMRPCLFRIGVWSCGFLACGHRLVCFVLSSPWMSYSGVSFLPDLQYFTYFVIIVMSAETKGGEHGAQGLDGHHPPDNRHSGEHLARAEGRQKATEAQVKKVPATRTSRNPVHPS